MEEKHWIKRKFIKDTNGAVYEQKSLKKKYYKAIVIAYSHIIVAAFLFYRC